MDKESSGKKKKKRVQWRARNLSKQERPKIFSLKLASACLRGRAIVLATRQVHSKWNHLHSALTGPFLVTVLGVKKKETHASRAKSHPAKGLAWWCSPPPRPMISETLGQNTVCNLPGQQHAEYIKLPGASLQGTTLSDLGPLKCVVSGFQRPEVWDQGANKAMLPLKTPGSVCSRLLSSFW